MIRLLSLQPLSTESSCWSSFSAIVHVQVLVPDLTWWQAQLDSGSFVGIFGGHVRGRVCLSALHYYNKVPKAG